MQFGKLCLTDPLHLILRFLTFVYAQLNFCPSLPYENYSPSNEPYWVKNPHVQNRSNIMYKVKMMTATTTSTNTIKQKWNMSIMYQKKSKVGSYGHYQSFSKKILKNHFYKLFLLNVCQSSNEQIWKIFYLNCIYGLKIPACPTIPKGVQNVLLWAKHEFQSLWPTFWCMSSSKIQRNL